MLNALEGPRQLKGGCHFWELHGRYPSVPEVHPEMDAVGWIQGVRREGETLYN